MKHLLLPLIAIACLLTACDQDVTYVTTIQKMAADGLNLQAVTDLATKVKTTQEFEEKLNEPGNIINNLDLNEDQTVDFIKVTEINDETGKGFSLTTEVVANEEQELVVIQFEVDEESDITTVQATGNSNIYGNHHYYHNRLGLTDVLIWNYFLGGHRPYFSSWGYNRYPDYYQKRQPRSSSAYKSLHQSKPYSSSYKSSTRSMVKSPVKSPNFNKTASSIKAPLKNPTTSQRSFQARNPSKTLSKGSGFKTSAKYGRSGFSRSSSSFGGGK